MLSYRNTAAAAPRIVIAGLGGAGANILRCFAGQKNSDISLHVMALDERIGRAEGVDSFLLLGEKANHGLGSGGDPSVGAAAARESESALSEMLHGADLLVLVTGLGGGTGSGAAPEVARLARELGVFLVVVATMPFSFEGRRRRRQAERALAQLAVSANVLLCFENDHLDELIQKGRGAHEAFAEADRLLACATAAVPMIASSPGLINLGLDELKQALRSRNSRCIFGSGSARGVDRARRAAERALESPLLSWRRALGRAGAVIVHIAGGETLTLAEVRTAMETLADRMDEEAEIFFGIAVKPRLGDELRVTILSSIDPESLSEPPPAAAEETPEPEKAAGAPPEKAAESGQPSDPASRAQEAEPEAPEPEHEPEETPAPAVRVLEDEGPAPAAPPAGEPSAEEKEPAPRPQEPPHPGPEQYELNLDSAKSAEEASGEDEDLDVPPSMRSDKWEKLFED